jgi:hypothetical protein
VLAEQFTHRTTLFEMLALGIVLFLTSGLITAFNAPSSTPQKPGEARTPSDIIIIAVGLILFVVILLIGSAVAKGGA